MTFPVQPYPISWAHCWHQAVRVRKADEGDRYGDIVVDTERSRRAFRRWLKLTRPAGLHSPDGTRRPYWLLRPVRPEREAFRLPEGNGGSQARVEDAVSSLPASAEGARQGGMDGDRRGGP